MHAHNNTNSPHLANRKHKKPSTDVFAILSEDFNVVNYSQMSDEDLMDAVSADDDLDAYRVLHTQNWDHTIDVCEKRYENCGDPEEIANKSWGKVWEKRKKWNVGGAFRAWLNTVIRNTALDMWRREEAYLENLNEYAASGQQQPSQQPSAESIVSFAKLMLTAWHDFNRMEHNGVNRGYGVILRRRYWDAPGPDGLAVRDPDLFSELDSLLSSPPPNSLQLSQNLAEFLVDSVVQKGCEECTTTVAAKLCGVTHAHVVNVARRYRMAVLHAIQQSEV